MVFGKNFFIVIGLFLLVFLSIYYSYLWRKVDNKKTGLVVLNVLSKDMYDDCHIEGSINIPMDVMSRAKEIIDKNAEVVTYCSNYLCGASAAARKKLIEMGFKNVLVYEGGVAEWYQKGFPVKGKKLKPYLKNKVEALKKEKKDYELTAEELKAKMGYQAK